MVSIWLIALGFFATAYIGTGRRQYRTFEILDFTGAFAIAAATSAVLALILGGKKRWAIEAALPILILIVTPISGAYVLFWMVPTQGQFLLSMSLRDFLSFRRQLLDSAREIAHLTVPTGAILGIMIGGIAGFLLLLAGRRPRFAGGLVLGLLLACVIGSVHIDAFRRVTDFVVRARLQGANRLQYAWYMTEELGSAMGATAGAVVGAVLSGGAVWMVDRSQRAANDPALEWGVSSSECGRKSGSVNRSRTGPSA